jgi:hypothetical protein
LDLNYLYHRHQISLFMAQHAASERARLAHGGLAEAYAGRIAAARTPPQPSLRAPAFGD